MRHRGRCQRIKGGAGGQGQERSPRGNGGGESETPRGLVDLWMPVRDGLMRAVARLVQVIPCRPPLGQTISQGAEAMQEGKHDEEQDCKPDAVRGQRLGQNVKPRAHKTNLPDSRHHESFIAT
jgi:hypothetical protein